MNRTIENELFERFIALGTMTDGKEYKMPVPFNDPSFTKSKSKSLNASLLKGAISLARVNLEADETVPIDEATAFKPYHLAIGTKNLDGENNEIFVEYIEDENSDYEQVVYFNTKTLQIKGLIHKLSTNHKIAGGWNISPNTYFDGTAIWIALLLHICSCKDSAYENAVAAFLDIKNYISSKPLTMKDVPYEQVKEIEELLLKKNLPAFDITDSVNPSLVDVLDVNKVRRGKISPTSEGLIIYGKYNYFNINSSSTNISLDLEKYKNISWKRSFEKLTDDEKLLVPSISKEHIVSSYEKDILDDIYRTSSKSYERRISNILLVGAAGTGKSETARYISSVLKRPFVTQTFSAYTSEEDIRGSIMVLLDDEEISNSKLTEQQKTVYKAIKRAKEDDSLVEIVAEALGLPSMSEIYFDPEGSYETITGNNAPDGVDEFTVRDMLERLVGAEIKGTLKATESVTTNSVQYKYIPSPIVNAIKNGYILEIQEPSNCLQQGVLTSLYDVLEKASIGTLTLPHGVIKRHDDFMCIMTTNTDYTGCKPLSPALISRMQETILLEPPSKETLVQRVIAKTGLKDISLANKVVDVYSLATSKGQEIGASGEATPRALYNFADAISDNIDAFSAFKRMVLGAITFDHEEQQDIIVAIEDCELFA